MITMGGFSLPSRTIREMIVSSIDVVVQATRLRDGSRRITHVTEVMGMEGDVIITQDIFRLRHDRRGFDRPHHRPAPLDRHRPAAVLGTCALLW
jgi:pilus assembly protein CpaF